MRAWCALRARVMGPSSITEAHGGDRLDQGFVRVGQLHQEFTAAGAVQVHVRDP
jgi:hypothetical protein